MKLTKVFVSLLLVSLIIIGSANASNITKHYEVNIQVDQDTFESYEVRYSVATFTVHKDQLDRYIADEYLHPVMYYYFDHWQWYPMYLEDISGLVFNGYMSFEDMLGVFYDWYETVAIVLYYDDYKGQEVDYVTGKLYPYEGEAIQIIILGLDIDVMLTLEYYPNEYDEDLYDCTMAFLVE